MTNNDNLKNIRHSLAHILALAVLKHYPKAKLGIGPAIESGFYYDFDFGDDGISEADLPKLEKEMKRIIKEGWEFSGKKVTAAEAKKQFKDQPFKLDLIKEFVGQKKQLTIYFTCPPTTYNPQPTTCFIDLCRGGHVKSTKEINPDAFKLTHIAGAYWKGSELNLMLTRIYGAAFGSKKELDEYLKNQAEAEKRDHRKLGKVLGLFVNSELVGAGLPLFTPKGTMVWRKLREFSENLKKEAGYSEVHIPHLAKYDLYRVSGHLEKFKDDIFYVKGKDSKFIVKPMNCPHHTQIYASRPRSYRDLPVKLYETTTVYRDEKSGELGGLVRVRSITQDDSHAFCREDQIEREFELLIKGALKAVKAFEIKNYRIDLSLRDPKNKKAYLGDDRIWKKSQKELERILKKNKVNYKIKEGEAAFYGPKIDFVVEDSLKREWQITTIQLDFNMPKKFGLEYIDEKGNKKTPVMIHSAFLGSLERFMGIMIEHFAGAFPLWLAPVQAVVLPISEKSNKYGKEVYKKLKEAGIRTELNDSGETIGKKIREAEKQKIPYILVVGEKEKKSKSVSVRVRGKGDIGSQKLSLFTDKIKKALQP